MFSKIKLLNVFENCLVVKKINSNDIYFITSKQIQRQKKLSKIVNEKIIFNKNDNDVELVFCLDILQKILYIHTNVIEKNNLEFTDNNEIVNIFNEYYNLKLSKFKLFNYYDINLKHFELHEI